MNFTRYPLVALILIVAGIVVDIIDFVAMDNTWTSLSDNRFLSLVLTLFFVAINFVLATAYAFHKSTEDSKNVRYVVIGIFIILILLFIRFETIVFEGKVGDFSAWITELLVPVMVHLASFYLLMTGMKFLSETIFIDNLMLNISKRKIDSTNKELSDRLGEFAKYETMYSDYIDTLQSVESGLLINAKAALVESSSVYDATGIPKEFEPIKSISNFRNFLLGRDLARGSQTDVNIIEKGDD